MYSNMSGVQQQGQGYVPMQGASFQNQQQATMQQAYAMQMGGSGGYAPAQVISMPGITQPVAMQATPAGGTMAMQTAADVMQQQQQQQQQQMMASMMQPGAAGMMMQPAGAGGMTAMNMGQMPAAMVGMTPAQMQAMYQASVGIRVLSRCLALRVVWTRSC